MKRILSVVLAMAMVLAFAGIAMADDTSCDFSIVLKGTESAAEDGTYAGTLTEAAPAAVGDIIAFDIVASNISTGEFVAGQVTLKYSDNLVPCLRTKAHTSIESVSDVKNTMVAFSKDEEETEITTGAVNTAGYFEENYGSVLGVSLYNADGSYATDSATLVTVYFKVVKAGDVSVSFVTLEDTAFGTTLVDKSATNFVTNNCGAAYTVEIPGDDEDIEITAVAAPEAVTVKVGETVTLPETVVGTYADGTVDVPVTWAAVDTSAVGTYTVEGTLTAPEGYKLAADVTVAATVTVEAGEEPAPETKEITSVTAPEAVTVKVGEAVELPATVVGTDANGNSVDVTVAWDDVDTSAEGTYTVAGTLTAPDGYVLADGVTVSATVVVEKDEEPEPTPGEDGYAVTATATAVIEGAKQSVKVAVSENDAYTGSTAVNDSVAIIVMYMKGNTPVAVVTSTAVVGSADGAGVALENLEADTAVVSVVQNVDITAVLSGANIGDPLLPSITVELD